MEKEALASKQKKDT